MPDPITTQLTQKALTGVAKPDAGLKKPNYQVEQSAFGQMLDTQMSASNTATEKLISMVDNMTGESGPSMKAIPANEINVDLTKVGEGVSKPADKKVALFDIFKEINGSQNNMDALIEQLGSGKKFTTHEMIRLQVFAHQHTVTYELVSKFGEMANRAIQTPFQMQV